MRAAGGKQQAASSRRQAASSKSQAASSMQHAASRKRQAASRVRQVATPFVLLKANALALPLRAGSVSLVMATPPHFGVKNLGGNGFCTGDAEKYERLIGGVKAEALRVLRSGGYLALYTREGGSRIRKVFDISQKRRAGRLWRLERKRARIFAAPYVDVEGFWWWAMPQAVFRRLIEQYSDDGDCIAHVFSGSGNGAIAAMQTGRKMVSVDLHYHALARRRAMKEWKRRKGSGS